MRAYMAYCDLPHCQSAIECPNADSLPDGWLLVTQYEERLEFCTWRCMQQFAETRATWEALPVHEREGRSLREFTRRAGPLTRRLGSPTDQAPESATGA